MEPRPRPGSAATLDAETPKKARHRLSQMRMPIQQLADSNIIGIVFAEPDGPIVDANDEFLRMVGYSREDLEGARLDWVKMTPHEWGFATRQAAKQIEETGKAAPFEKEFFRKDGARVPVLVGIAASPKPDTDALCFILDLSDRKQAEQDVDRLMIERFAMLDAVDAGIFGVDMEGRCTFINPAALQMLGYEAEECLGRNMHDLIHFKSARGEPISREACPVSNAVRECMRMRTDDDVLWRKDGSSFVVEHSASPIVVNGHAEGSVISFKDISERKRAEESLRASEERFRGAFAHAAAGMYIADFEGRFLEVNQALCRMTGYSEAELLVLSFQAITHPDDVESPVGFLGQLLRKELPRCIAENRYIRKNGSTLWVRCSVAPLCDGSGNPIRFVSIIEDITEQVQAKLDLRHTVERIRRMIENTPTPGGDGRQHLEEQLRKAQNMDAAGHLAVGLAHDFNNLLSVILGYSELLEQKLTAEDPRLGNVAEIKKAGQRAAALIRNMSASGRKHVARPSVISVNHLIRDMEAMLGSMLGSNVELVLRLDPASGNIQADPGRIEQAILNLAINAHDAMPEGGKLVIESKPDPGVTLPASLPPGAYVLLTFTDSGRGIDEVTRARMFEPFFSTKEAGVATGPGLSTVAGIIAESGGAIAVSREVDCGATFSIYLPLVEEPLKVNHLLEDRNTPARLLIVDDDVQVRGVLAAMLELEGYAVVQASNGREAQVFCQKALPDLIITDLAMPEQDGLETIHPICRDWPQLPVIAISGAFGGVCLDIAKKMGADVVLRKPVEPEMMRREVRRLIAK